MNPPKMTFTEILHPEIGRIRGLQRSNDIIQFLGIQYATLENRFARGVLRDYAESPEEVLDATNVGPLGAIASNACELEQRIIQKSLPTPVFDYVDTDSLTLHISAPPKQYGSNLPVLVFIHGGGFTTGSNSFPQNDLANITKFALQLQLPIIAVGVNYRVGLPGFLHTRAMAHAGYKPNNGLDDQILALRWIRKFIAGFGGDPERVTFLGESAGAASGYFHLQGEQPLFHQLVAMSGTALLRPRRAERLELSFAKTAKALGIETLSEQKQLEVLVQTPTRTLVEKTGRDGLVGPTVDGNIIPKMATYEQLSQSEDSGRVFPGGRQNMRVLTGHCQDDGTIWYSRLLQRTDVFPRTLTQYLRKALDPIDPGLVSKVIELYGIDSSATSNSDLSTQSVLRLGNDITFAIPAEVCAQTLSNAGAEVFLYNFHCPNPWDGRWKGYANHVLDIAFALGNYDAFLSLGQMQSACRFATNIIEFTNGMPPWRALNNNEGPETMVYYAAADGATDESKSIRFEDSTRSATRTRLIELVGKDRLDKVLDGWTMFMEHS